MKIQSTPVKISYQQELVHLFLHTPSNYRSLMPDGVVFTHTENTFSFQQGGMPLIAVRLKSSTPFEKIIWETAGGSVAFELSLSIEKLSHGQSAVCFIFQGQLNPMLQMMVKKPLTNLLENFAQKLAQQKMI